MPAVRLNAAGVTAILTHQDGWKPGDQPPDDPNDYLGWHAWAAVQWKSGLRQKQCGKCGLWRFPQELSDQTVTTTMYTKRFRHEVKQVAPVCRKCAGQ